jgi:ABC-type sugar transport system ATPase subunit
VSPSLLEAISISKSFAGVHLLRRVSFDLAAGEVHALVGERVAGLPPEHSEKGVRIPPSRIAD